MKRLLVIALLSLAASCGEGTGSLRVRVSGEQAAVSGYPAGELAFVDGWSLVFDRVVVSLGGLDLRASDGDDARVATDPVLVDLRAGPALAYVLDDVPARRWDRIAWRLVPATEDARDATPIASDVRARMVAGGWTVLVEGVATDGEVDVAFSFGLPFAVENRRCVDGSDGTHGVLVRPGAVTETELTLHLDHLFLDSFAAAEPAMRFEPMAALAGADATVTLDELTAHVADVRDREGASIVADDMVVAYDPGPVVLDPPTLRSFVLAAAARMGHFGGEGPCDVVTAP